MKSLEDLSRLEGTTPPEADAQLRETIYRYVMNETDPKRHGVIRRLYELWDEWNEEHFEGRMVPPIILLSEPGQTKSYGDCGPVSGFACSSQIRIRPSILDGTLRDLKNGSGDPQGLGRFLEDVLLHEMIHQWQQEVTGERDAGYHGHGTAFSRKANEIGEKLGLPRVGRTCKKRDRKEGEESPSQWPHDVRPDGYYLGAHVPSSRDARPSGRICLPLNIDEAADILREHFDVEELCQRLRA
jgi:hypothetical protein